MDNFNDLGNWYQLFKNGEDPQPEAKPVETTKPSNALANLMLYAAQAAGYADFISSAMKTVDSDIKADITKDINIPGCFGTTPCDGPAPTMASQTWQPLAMVAANRAKLVEYADKLSELIKAIDSILSRVKTKE